LSLCDDLHLLAAAVLDLLARAKSSMLSGHPPKLDEQGLALSTDIAYDISHLCRSCVEGRWYALKVLAVLAALDFRANHVWHRTRLDPRLMGGIPQRNRFGYSPDPQNSLKIASSVFVRDASVSSLNNFILAYSARPCVSVLREPFVAERLFAVAYLAQCLNIHDAAFK